MTTNVFNASARSSSISARNGRSPCGWRGIRLQLPFGAVHAANRIAGSEYLLAFWLGARVGRVSASRLAVVACVCASVLVAGSAGGAGAAVTVGPDVTATPTGSTSCAAPSGALTWSNESLVSGLVASPMDGVVVRWRATMSGPGNPPTGPTLRIVRATGLGRFTGAGSSGPTPPFTGVGGPFAARLPIRAGDRIGIDLPCHGIA